MAQGTALRRSEPSVIPLSYPGAPTLCVHKMISIVKQWSSLV